MDISPERKRMMQQWADHLDKLRAGAGVTPLRVAPKTPGE